MGIAQEPCDLSQPYSETQRLAGFRESVRRVVRLGPPQIQAAQVMLEDADGLAELDHRQLGINVAYTLLAHRPSPFGGPRRRRVASARAGFFFLRASWQRGLHVLIG